MKLVYYRPREFLVKPLKDKNSNVVYIILLLPLTYLRAYKLYSFSFSHWN
jgi:hypothetical protein